MSTDRRAVPDSAVSRCWRVGLGVRIGIGVAILATAPIALISTVRQVDHPISDPITAIVMYTVVWWLALVRPAVWLSPDQLVVRNPLWTHRIARENVVSAKSGALGAVISRRVGRRCIAVALHKPLVVTADPKVDLINYWAQTPPSSNRDEAIESMYPDKPRRSPFGEIVAAVALAVVFTIPAVLLAWPRHPWWFFPATGLVVAIALVPLALTEPRSAAPRRDH